MTWLTGAGRRTSRACVRGLLPVLLVGAAGGCAWNAPMSTVEGRSDFAHAILHVYTIITVATIIIALLVATVLAWVLIRFRQRPGAMAVQTHGHSLLEISWTIAPALVLLIIAIPTIQVIFRTQATAPPPNALTVTVRASQWWWEFRYPSLGLVTANELHVPVGRPIVLQLEGVDVIHSFWVPRLGGKRDVIPGRHNTLDFTADTPGEYFGQCAEFCGTSHANMRMRVIVDAADAFERWVAAERAPAAEPSGAAADGKAIFARSACVGCHTIRGVSAGAVGPDLTHFASRGSFAGSILANTPANVQKWILDPPGIKPGTKMPALGLSAADARAVAAYLASLK